MSKKRTNSCVKGKVGERAAAAYLCSIGFKAERAARNGVTGCHDLIVHDLPNLSIECKYGVKGLDIGTKAMDDIVVRAATDAMNRTADECAIRRWAILWFAPRKCWRLTFAMPSDGTTVTTTGPASICSVLRRLNTITPILPEPAHA